MFKFRFPKYSAIRYARRATRSVIGQATGFHPMKIAKISKKDSLVYKHDKKINQGIVNMANNYLNNNK